jgi:phage terminase large subunit
VVRSAPQGRQEGPRLTPTDKIKRALALAREIQARASKSALSDYTPRAQFADFHKRTERFSVGVAHRRCGKTVACINDLIQYANDSSKTAYRAAYVAPYLKQAKDVAWEYLKRYSEPHWNKPPNESELYVELKGGKRIRIYGADNADALRGGYLDDVILDEYADMYPSVWGTIIRPMLADRRGRATFIGTPKGRNAFHTIYQRGLNDPQWFTFFMPASETGILSDQELADAKLDMTPEEYAQEFECSFDAAIKGAYFGKEMAEADRAGRITSVEWDKELPVYTAWDLGMGDSTAIWFWQAVGGEIRIIDFYETNGESVEHYAKVLHAKPYRYAQDFVPHDARVRELGTGRTRLETMLSHKLKPRVIPAHKIMDGINAARVLMPRIWFDAVNCADGIEALRQYKAEYDEKLRAFRDNPKHDWTSHAADAFRYLAVAWKEMAQPVTPPPPAAPRGITEMTFDEAIARQTHVKRRI